MGEEIKKTEKLYYLSFKLSKEPTIPSNSIFMNYSIASLGSRPFLELKRSFGKTRAFIYKILYRCFFKNSFPDTIIWEKTKLEKNLKKIIVEKQIDMVVAFVMPYGFLELGDYVKKLGCKWVVDIGDPISNNVAKKKDRTEKKRIEYEKEFLGKADAKITTNNETKSYYKRLFNSKKNLVVESVYAGIPLEFLVNKEKKLNKNILKVVYAGIFYPDGVRDPSNLIELIEENNFNGKMIKLEVYGCRLDKFSNYKNVSFVQNKIPQSELFKKYKEADLLLFVDNKSSIQVPSKLFELLALKRPVIFVYYDEASPSVKIAEKFEHVFLAHNNKEDIKITIESCLNNYDDIKYKYPAIENTWNKRAENLLEILRTIN